MSWLIPSWGKKNTRWDWNIFLCQKTRRSLKTHAYMKKVEGEGVGIWKFMMSLLFLIVVGLWGEIPPNISKMWSPYWAAGLYPTFLFLCIIINHLPRYRPLVSSLSKTLQGSFPCSNKEITSGLGMQRPTHKRRKETFYVVGVPGHKSYPMISK